LESTSGDCAFLTYELVPEWYQAPMIYTYSLESTSGDCAFLTYELVPEWYQAPMIYTYGLSTGSDSCVITGTSHAATINVPTYLLATIEATEVVSYVQQTGTTTEIVTINCGAASSS
jgi:hypothetical protein